MFGKLSKAESNLSCKIFLRSGVMKIKKILDPGCKRAVDSTIHDWKASKVFAPVGTK